MTALLSADDILTIRRKFIGDQIDLHPEFGTSPVTSGSKSAGSSTLALTALGSGVIKKGCVFAVIQTSQRRDRYTVTAEATITANAATVSVSPLLLTDVASGCRVEPEPYYRSAYNLRTRTLFFSDEELQAFCQTAFEKFADLIYTSDTPTDVKYRAVRYLALQELLSPGSKFILSLLADDPRGNAKYLFDQMQDTLKQDEAFFSRKYRSAFTFPIVR